MTVLTAICLSQVPTASGAAGNPNLSLGHSTQAQETTASPRVAPDKTGAAPKPTSQDRPKGCPSARKAVKYYAGRIAYWRDKMGAAPSGRSNRLGNCPRYLSKVLRAKSYALRREYTRYAAERRARYRRLYEKWRCIHEHEGAWNSNTGNGYWGGLQMDWGFMHTYGAEFIRRWGLAHRWPVWAQLEAAERAYWGYAGYAGRGYSPWGTRGMCGV